RGGGGGGAGRPPPEGYRPAPGAGRTRPLGGHRRECPTPGSGPPHRPDPPRSPPPAADGSHAPRRYANPLRRTNATRRAGGPSNPARPTRPPTPCRPAPTDPSAGWIPSIDPERPCPSPPEMCGKKPFQRETPGLCPGVRSPPSPRPALEKVRRTFSRRRNLPVARPSANGIGEGRDAAPPAEEVARGPGGKRLGWLSASRVPFPGPERIAGGRGLHPRPDARGSAKDRPTWLFSIL